MGLRNEVVPKPSPGSGAFPPNAVQGLMDDPAQKIYYFKVPEVRSLKYKFSQNYECNFNHS